MTWIDLFGSIADYDTGSFGSQPFGPLDFGPRDDKNHIIKFKRTAKWMGLESPLMQKYAYEFCSPVGTVVDRLAEYDLTGKLCITRKGGKGKEKELKNAWSEAILKLFDQPNVLQSWEQFRGQQTVYKKVFGFCPVLPIMPVGFRGKRSPEKAFQLVNLPPWLFKPILVANSNVAEAASLESLIQRYECTLNGKTIKIDPSEVIILKDGFMQNSKINLTLPLSKLVGLDMAVSNFCAAMEADNVLLKKKGPLGFIGPDPGNFKDSGGILPYTKGQRNELQGALEQYGLNLSQFQYVISRRAMRWNPISFNVKDLDTSGTIIKSEKAICHRLMLPYALYEETENTYANDSDNALATCYTTNVIPNANRDFSEYERFFKANDNNACIALDFEEVGVLQEDKADAAAVMLTNAQAATLAWKDGQITKNEYRMMIGQEELPGTEGDVYYVEPVTQPINNNTDGF